MAFQSIPGIKGKIYVPDDPCPAAKHPCRDCYACQHCSDDRCRLCRDEGRETTGERARRCGSHGAGAADP